MKFEMRWRNLSFDLKPRPAQQFFDQDAESDLDVTEPGGVLRVSTKRMWCIGPCRKSARVSMVLSTPALSCTPRSSGRSHCCATKRTNASDLWVCNCSIGGKQLEAGGSTGARWSGHLLFTLENLNRAYRRCHGGKRNTKTPWPFRGNLEENLLDLCDELNKGTYVPGPSMAFLVEKPKRREISAADFRDRMVHHILVDHLGPGKVLIRCPVPRPVLRLANRSCGSRRICPDMFS
jgi:hypothetical protein